ARELGVSVRGEFGEEYGVTIGVWGELDLERVDLRQRLTDLLGSTPRLMAFGPARTRRVGIVTGGAGSLIGQAAAAGLDTYITGEGAHHTYFDAEELGVNVFYAGHYATETVGVKALAEHLHERFGLPWVFLDHPTGLWARGASWACSPSRNSWRWRRGSARRLSHRRSHACGSSHPLARPGSRFRCSWASSSGRSSPRSSR